MNSSSRPKSQLRIRWWRSTVLVAAGVLVANNAPAGTLTVQDGAPAAMGGSAKGLAVGVTDTSDTYVRDDTPAFESHYHVRFYLNPGTFLPPDGKRARVFIAAEDKSPPRVLAIILARANGQYYMSARSRQDDGSFKDPTNGDFPGDPAFFSIPTGSNLIEVDWTRSSGPGASDGVTSFSTNGTLRTTVTGVDNDTLGVDSGYLGTMTIKPGASGTVYLDEFASSR